MPPKRYGKAPATKPIADPWLPVELPKGAKIEIHTQDRQLIVTKEKVDGTDAYHALLTCPGIEDERCIALCKRPSDAYEAFKILTSCSNRNIAKPIGVWEEQGKNIAYIVFSGINGALKSIDRMMIFELEDISASSANPPASPSAVCFTDQGCMILLDLVMAVKCINELQLPMKPLKLQKRSIFYQLKNKGQYHVLISDFEDQDKFHGGKGKSSRRVDSNKEQDVKTINWNGLGKFLKELSEKIKPNSELEHLVDFLEKVPMRFEDLVWEPAMWMLRTKLQLIREVFWRCDRDQVTRASLEQRSSLGLQSCIDKLAINVSRDSDTKKIEDKNLYDSMFFLRVCMLAHFDDTIKGCEQMVRLNTLDQTMLDHVKDQRTLLRFFMQERPDFLVKFIWEIRLMGCIKKSPLLREGNGYMEEFHPTKTAK